MNEGTPKPSEVTGEAAKQGETTRQAHDRSTRRTTQSKYFPIGGDPSTREMIESYFEPMGGTPVVEDVTKPVESSARWTQPLNGTESPVIKPVVDLSPELVSKAKAEAVKEYLEKYGKKKSEPQDEETRSKQDSAEQYQERYGTPQDKSKTE